MMIVCRCQYDNCIFKVKQKNLFSNLLCVKNIYILIQMRCTIPLKSMRGKCSIPTTFYLIENLFILFLKKYKFSWVGPINLNMIIICCAYFILFFFSVVPTSFSLCMMGIVIESGFLLRRL